MAKRAARRPSGPGKKKKPLHRQQPARKKPMPGKPDRPSNDPPTATRRHKPKPSAAVNLPPREAGDRLQKLMAAAGVASRRECEVFIQEGRVEVDGQVVTELGVRVDPFKQRIHIDGEPLPRPKRVYFAVNKPEGVVCTARDPSGRQRVTDLLPPEMGRVFNVGRLDMASEGLILLTNDGELANHLTHPRHGVEKIYHVQVAGRPTAETLSQLRGGVYLAEGKAHFVNARIKSHRKSGTVLEVVLDEGRNREIRRVLARVGHKVQRLTRIAIGPVRLADLPTGAYRPLTPEEVKALRVAGPKPQKKEAKKASTSQGSRKPAPQKRTGQGPKKRPAAPPEKEKPRRTVLGATPTTGNKKKATSHKASKPRGKR